MANSIDEIDYKIIKLLQSDGRMRNTEIARKLDISESSVRIRLKKLLSNDYIQIAAIVNHGKLGYKILGNARIKAELKKSDRVAEEIKKIDELWYIARLSGAVDFDCEFSIRSQEELRNLIDRIKIIDGVVDLELSFRLELIKTQYDWNLIDMRDSYLTKFA